MTTLQIQSLSRSLIFLGLLLICSVTASFIAAFIGPVLFGDTVMILPGQAMPSDAASWWQLHLQNFISQAIGFGGAVFIASAMWDRAVPVGLRYTAGSISIGPLALVALTTLVSAPLMAFSYEWNVAAIPEGSMLEDIFKPLEDLMERVTTFLVTADGARRVVVILSVAAVPAIFEELGFRGALQPLLIKATGRAWLGILLTSLIFSAIHFQFYGFLPRVLLGLLFGWFAHRSGSILPGMVAHFLNNAAAAVTLWYTGSMTDDLFELETGIVLGSLALTAGAIWAYDRIMPSRKALISG